MASRDENEISSKELKQELLVNLANNEGEMIAVNKGDLLPGLPLPTNIFVRLTNGKFVLIAKKGEKFTIGELHVSKSQRVDSFYVRKADYQSAVEQNFRIVTQLSRRSDIPLVRRMAFLNSATESVFKQIQHFGVTPDSLQFCKSAVSAVCSMVKTREDFSNLITALSEIADHMVQESIACSALSVLIGRELGWSSEDSIEKLALSAFLRDVGLKEISKDITAKNRIEMTAEEKGIWETHAFRGAELLQTLPEVAPEIIAVALEHHENAIGQGFPRRIRDAKMNPFSKVVALADTFVHLTLGPGKTKTSEQAIHHIEFTLGCPFNKACLVALKRSLQLDGHAPEIKS